VPKLTSPSGELRDQAGTNVNLIASSPIGSLATRRWPRAGKEWFAATKHDRMEVESILINKTKVR